MPLKLASMLSVNDLAVLSEEPMAKKPKGKGGGKRC